VQPAEAITDPMMGSIKNAWLAQRGKA
jgi:hypothetical protein